MMPLNSAHDSDTSVAFGALVGLQLVRSKNLQGTRHFYFARPLSVGAPAHCTLGLECPWRIRLNDVIVVGSEDYYERAEDNTDPAWELGMPGGHFQDQKFAGLLGELREGDVVNTGTDFIVTAVTLDGCGGMQIHLGHDYVLEAFPSSAKRMEWILRVPGQPSWVLMNGVVNKTRRARGGSEREGDAAAPHPDSA